MDAFNYLAVLISIILGLGITHLLTGLGRLIEERDRVRIYGPTLAWAGVLLLIHVQTWWSMFGMRVHTEWSFFAFLVVLLQPILLYLAAALILPEFASEGTAPDLRVYFDRQRQWFFGLLVALLIVSLTKDLVLGGALPERANTLFHLVLFGLFVSAIVMRGERAHRLIAAAGVLLIVVYITLLFAQLQ